MKAKNRKLIIFIFILSFVISIFSTTSFAGNVDITTYSPHCLLMETC